MEAQAKPYDQELQELIMIEDLKQQTQSYIKEIHNSEMPIERVLFSPLSTVFISCQNDKRVLVYDSVDFQPLHAFQMSYAIKDAKFLKEDQILVIDTLGMVKLFDLFKENSAQEPIDLIVMQLISCEVSHSHKWFGAITKNLESKGQHCIQITKLNQFLKEKQSVNKFQFQLQCQNNENYDNFVFDLDENHFYVSFEKNKVAKFFIDEEKGTLEKIKEVNSELQAIKKMQMSQKYEFLIVNGENGVTLYDPQTLKGMFQIKTDFQVNQAIISNKIYSAKHQKFHVILACGYDAVNQAKVKTDSNYIQIHNFLTGECLMKFWGSVGALTSVGQFEDGQGIVFSTFDGMIKILRFDPCYDRALV